MVDFLDPEKSRPNTPEERVRQVYARKLHYDYGYPNSVMAIEAPIQIGSRQMVVPASSGATACTVSPSFLAVSDRARLASQR